MPDFVYPPDPLSPVLLGATINLLAGAPGTGKSTFLAWFARQVHERTPLWGYPWGEVAWQGIICADRSWQQSTRRWFALEGMQDLPAYSIQDDRKFTKSQLRQRQNRIAIFEKCLNILQPPRNALIYVDPLAPFLGGDLNDYDSCMVACMELRELCLKHGITIIGTAHSSKQKSDKKSRYLRLQDRILGSTALFGYTDTQMYLASPEEIERDHYAFLWHPHHAPTSTFAMSRRVENGCFLPGDQLEGTAPIPRPLPDWLAEALASGPKPFVELLNLAALHHTSRATLHRTLQDLERQSTVQKPQRGLYALVKPS